MFLLQIHLLNSKFTHSEIFGKKYLLSEHFIYAWPSLSISNLLSFCWKKTFWLSIAVHIFVARPFCLQLKVLLWSFFFVVVRWVGKHQVPWSTSDAKLLISFSPSIWVGIKTPSTFVCFHVDEDAYLNLMEANNPDSLCYLPNQAALIHLLIWQPGIP
jgi:hypothetical protein